MENNENKDNQNTEHKYSTVLDMFKNRVADSGAQVLDGVVTSLTNAELKKREAMVLKGLEIIQGYDKEIKKIKPDQENYDEHNELVNATYSQSKSKELKGLKEKKAKLDKALDMALGEKPDFSKLKELVK